MNIQEIRAKYPEYDHASDQELADALHKKYYAHAPKEIFYEKIGFKPEQEQGFFNKLPRNIATGISEMGRGLANTPHNLANLIGQGDSVPNLSDPNFDFAQAYGLKGKPTLSDKIIQGLSQYGPSLAIPGANLGRASKAIGSIPKIGATLAEAAEQALPQAAFGATQNENPLEGAAEGGLGAIGGTFAAKGLEQGYNALRPSVRLRGHLSPKELEKNLKATEGTETGLGRVINNPTLNRMFENILPHVLGSGAEKTMQRNAENIISKGTKIVDKMRGDLNPENYGMKIQEALKSASQEARAGKNANYDALNTLADKHGLKVGRDNFQKTAFKVLGDINQSQELKHEFGKGLYSDLIRYAKNPQGNNLKLTNIFRGKLGDKANELYREGKMHEYNIVNDLKNSLGQDIEHAFKESGKPELKEAYTKSQKEYKEKFAPFEDKDIVKFTRGGGDPDLMLNHFLRIGTGDRSTLLSKLQNQLQSNKTQPKLISSAYFSRALNEDGTVNPLKLRTLYNKLGPKQKEVLLGKGKDHSEIKKYVDLVGKNTEGFNLMFNPKTGARNTPFLAQMGALVSAPAHIKTVGLSAAAGKMATKLLSSPSIREKLVTAMIKNKSTDLPGLRKASAKAGSALSGMNGKDKEQKPLELLLTKRK